MIGGLIEEEERGLDEQGTSQGDSHPPPTTEILRGHILALWCESETTED
jgi:hypothetical protein